MTTVPDFSLWAHRVSTEPRYSLKGTTVDNLAMALQEAYDQGFVYGKRVGYELGKEYPDFNSSKE